MAEKSRPMYLPLADNDIVPLLMCRGGVPCTGVLSRDDPVVYFSKRINETFCTFAKRLPAIWRAWRHITNAGGSQPRSQEK